MRSTSLGKQRASRRSHRNGAVCRFLAALGASVILGFGVGAPIAAAQSASHVSLHDGGGDTSRADQNDHLRERLERLYEQVRDEHHERDHQGMQGQSTPPVTVAPVTVPPVTVPPVNLPNIPGRLPATPNAGAAAAAATVTRPGGRATTTAAAGAGGASEAAPAQQALAPPAAAPSSVPRNPVARALRTARSYGPLLALAAAVVAFLMIQGRVDRRDPRILSASGEDRLSFRDFE
jgi:hypothetical protein